MMLMKRLMDEFHELSQIAKSLDDFEASMMFDAAEAWANECHGLTDQELRTRLEAIVNDFQPQDSQVEALNLIDQTIQATK